VFLDYHLHETSNSYAVLSVLDFGIGWM